MPSTTQFSPLSLNYARSLLDLAGDNADAIGHELADIRQIVDDTPAFGLYLSDPAIGHVERGQALGRIFQGKVSPLLYNFLRVLDNHHRLNILVEVVGAYGELLEEKLGKVEVDLTVAKPLSPDQLANAQQKISQALKRDAVVHTYVDESIIGGMVIRVQDQLIDASVRTQLKTIKQQMLAKMPK